MLKEDVLSNQYITFGVCFPDSFSPSDLWSGGHINAEGLSHDELSKLVLESVWNSPSCYLPALVGRYSYGVSPEVKVYRGTKPRPTSWGMFDVVRTVSANWHNARNLLAGHWDRFATSSVPKLSGENEVFHVNLRGSVRTGITDGDKLVPEGINNPVLPDKLDVSTSVDGVSFEPYGSDYTTARLYPDIFTRYEQLVNQFEGQTFAYPGDNFPGCQTIELTYSDIDFSFVDGVLQYLEYFIDWKRLDRCGFTAHKDVFRRFRIQMHFSFEALVPVEPIPDGILSIDDLVNYHLDYRCLQYFSEQATPPGGTRIPEPHAVANYDLPDEVSLLDLAGDAIPFHRQHNGLVKGFDALMEHGFIAGRPTPMKGLRDFWNAVDKINRDLAPSVFLSTQDAIDTHFPTLEGNYLETLSDLRDVSSLFEGVSGLRNFFRLANSRGIFSNGKELLELLTDAQLLYAFAVAPSVSDAKDIADRGKMIYERYTKGNLFSRHTINGTFTWSIPDGAVDGFDGCILVARSKLVANFGGNSILSALLPVRAAGLLPTLGNVWDLVRFSFVADWFFNIGGRLSAVDTQAIILSLDCYYSVHSINVLWDIPSSTLSEYGIASVSSDLPALNYYCRSLMGTIPVLTSSRFDFWEAQGPSSLTTAGSFFYKVITR